MYFSWEGYEELERNLEKEYVVDQRDFACFFFRPPSNSAFCCVCYCEIENIE